MFYSLPSNTIPWLVGGLVITLLGLRGLQNYRKLHNPLSLFFAYSGFSAGLAFLLWSIPFAFTNNLTWLAYANITGDFFLYVFFVISAALVYYLTLKNKLPRMFFMTPFVLIAVIGWLSHCYGYLHNGVAIVNGNFEYTLPILADITQLVLLINVFIVGIILLTRLKQQSSARAKGAVAGIAILYIFSALGGSLNVITSGTPNQGIVVLSYILGFVLFVILLVLIRLFGSKRNTK